MDNIAKQTPNIDNPNPVKIPAEPKLTLKPKTDSKKNPLLLPIIILVAGLLALCASIIFLIIQNTPKTADAEYLVQIGTWAEESSNSVIWNFSEIGKGTLTTNDHLNDYDFTWTLEGDTLKIETDWLYTLEDSFIYSLDQDSKTLTLKSDTQEIKFVPAEN